jgi:hypothetical protein
MLRIGVVGVIGAFQTCVTDVFGAPLHATAIARTKMVTSVLMPF